MLGAGRDCLAGEQNIGPACGRSEVIGLHGSYAGSAGLAAGVCARALVVRGGAWAWARMGAWGGGGAYVRVCVRVRANAEKIGPDRS